MAALSGWDIAGFGTGLLGGILGQYQANKQLRFEKQQYEDAKKQNALQNLLNAQQFQTQKGLQERQQNLSSLNALANLRAENQLDARRRSFRNNLIEAGAR